MGCVEAGEVAKGEQSIANQGQEWMGIGIHATIKKAGSPSKYKSGQRKGDWPIGRKWDNEKQGAGLTLAMTGSMCHNRLSANNNILCLG